MRPAGGRGRTLGRYGLAVLAGALMAAGFAGFDHPLLELVMLVPLGLALEGVTLRGAVGPCLAFGFTAQLIGYHWLLHTFRVFTSFPLALCLLFLGLFAFYQGGALALFAWLARRAALRGAPAPLAWLAAIAAVEHLYPVLFPSYLGNALHAQTALLQLAELGGPILLSLLVVAVNVALLETARWVLGRRGRPGRELLVAAVLVAGAWAYGTARIRQVDRAAGAAPALRVGLVQANVGIYEKGDSPEEGLRRHLEQSLALLAREPVDLLVWPESAVNYVLPEDGPAVQAIVGADALGVPLLFGTLRGEDRPDRLHHFNSAYLLEPGGVLRGSYDKHKLLAFGEFIPLGEAFPKLYDLSPATARLTPGDHVRPLTLGPWRLSVLICYEDILPGFVRLAVREGDPQLLVNLTNDAWFGDSVEPWIHLALAKFRAVEQRRYLVRSTNSGVSAIVDPVGRVTVASGVFRPASLTGEVRLLEGGTVYRRLGDWVGWLGLLVCAFLQLRRAVPGMPGPPPGEREAKAEAPPAPSRAPGTATRSA